MYDTHCFFCGRMEDINDNVCPWCAPMWWRPRENMTLEKRLNMIDLMNVTFLKTISVKDVYEGIPTIPEGYEVTGFAPVEDGYFMATNGAIVHYKDKYNRLCTEPRLLLRKLPVTTKWSVEFELPEGQEPLENLCLTNYFQRIPITKVTQKV